jgi:Putative auto-transporter adhesin, head GIN domain
MSTHFLRTALLSGLLLGLLPSCDLGVDGNGNRSVEDRPGQDFTGVESRASLDVKIQRGDTFSVVVSIDSNLQPAVVTRVDGGTLIVDVTEPIGHTVSGPHVIVTMPVLRAAVLSGSGALSAETFPQDQPVDLILEGSGNLVFSGDVPTLTARLDGSGDLSLHGITGAADLTLEGSGNLDARDMSATTGDISLDGSGDLAATVTGSMRIALSGSGDIDLFGGGSLETSALDGSGSLRVH